MDLVKTATKLAFCKACDNGIPAKKVVFGSLKCGYNFRGEFYFVGKTCLMVSSGRGEAL